MNMFLSHTFFREYYFKDFIFSFKNAWIDTLVLIGVTLILSIILEFLKDKCKYNKVIQYIKVRVDTCIK